MSLPEDLDALCTQQLFRAAESSHLEELDDFDLVLSQTSGAELSALNSTLALYSRPRPQSRDRDEKSFSSRVPPTTTSAAQLNPARSAPTGSQIQKQVEVKVKFQKLCLSGRVKVVPWLSSAHTHYEAMV